VLRSKRKLITYTTSSRSSNVNFLSSLLNAFLRPPNRHLSCLERSTRPAGWFNSYRRTNRLSRFPPSGFSRRRSERPESRHLDFPSYNISFRRAPSSFFRSRFPPLRYVRFPRPRNFSDRTNVMLYETFTKSKTPVAEIRVNRFHRPIPRVYRRRIIYAALVVHLARLNANTFRLLNVRLKRV